MASKLAPQTHPSSPMLSTTSTVQHPAKPPLLLGTRATRITTSFITVCAIAFPAALSKLLAHPYLDGVSFPLCIMCISALSLLIVCICITYRRARPPPCYLVDFCCTVGNKSYAASADNFGRFLRSWKSVKLANLKFQFKVFVKSGVGEEARAPVRLFERGEDTDMQDARDESEDLILDAARKVLQKTGVDAKEIDIIIVNSSLFNPVPSLTAYLVHELKLRSNVKSFNLAGMGCSAGLIAIDLAVQLLRVHRNSNALVISTENITKNMYFGNDRSMMVSNCLFRCGCCASLLTNKPGKVHLRPKMKLLHLFRTNLAADQKAYDCVQHMEDEEGRLGVSLKISLLEVAGVALRANITRLAPYILPWTELIKVGASIAKKKVLKKSGQVYSPDFKKAIDHFCIHPGGRAVLNEIGMGLKLEDYDVEPGRMALERFGNTSSSGIWFALAYCEAKGRLKRGGTVWQIALGSGFKCNSAVWRLLRDVDAQENMESNPWSSCIKDFPISSAAVEQRAVRFREVYSKLFEDKGQDEDQTIG
ncbi:hypothetical protein GOP47_0027837 [Adiantum capillus-veneris]|nr:hypothetical protein GOP47_0027837 [Adiantum capillus-veneris]